jgi:16S rRNA (guanine1516-N2)-methyltransferase
MSQDITAVGYEEDYLQHKARLLAERLGFILEKEAQTCLFVGKEHLSLKLPGYSLLFAELSNSFCARRASQRKKQGVVRACKPSSGLKIIDATAGWGQDAAILASFGAQVLMLERHPVMSTLLEDALSRLKEQEPQATNLSLHTGSAQAFLNSLDKKEYPDVIYIDPMHPERSKSALVKKKMHILQEMIGPDEDALELIQLARMRVKQKVVVKWPQKSKPLLPTHACIEGRTVRFDIYVPD